MNYEEIMSLVKEAVEFWDPRGTRATESHFDYSADVEAIVDAIGAGETLDTFLVWARINRGDLVEAHWPICAKVADDIDQGLRDLGILTPA